MCVCCSLCVVCCVSFVPRCPLFLVVVRCLPSVLFCLMFAIALLVVRCCFF